MKKIKLNLIFSLLFIMSSICSAAILTGAKALQIESDKSSFFNCTVLGYLKNSNEIISLESKKISKYDLKSRRDDGVKGLYFDLFGAAGFSSYIESGELYLVSEVDDAKNREALAFSRAPASIELNVYIKASFNKETKEFDKFSLDCMKSL